MYDKTDVIFEKLNKLRFSKELNDSYNKLYNALMGLSKDQCLGDLRYRGLMVRISHDFLCGRGKLSQIYSPQKHYFLTRKRALCYQDKMSFIDLAMCYHDGIGVRKDKNTYDKVVELSKQREIDVLPDEKICIDVCSKKMEISIRFCDVKEIYCSIEPNCQISTYRRLNEQEIHDLVKDALDEQEKLAHRETLLWGEKINPDISSIKQALMFLEALKEVKEMFYSIQKEYNFPKATFGGFTCKSSWGVCYSRDKRIILNKRLIHENKNFVKYVIIHEYCHLMHPNHSKNFWNEVEKHFPDYREYEKFYKKIY